MTLYKQLLLKMIVIFTVIITVIFAIQFHNSREFLSEQQEIEVNNTVNAVGLALSPSLKDNDMLLSETLINALFDGSYYKSVRLSMIKGGAVIDRDYEPAAVDAPDWFLSIISIKPYSLTTRLTSGWAQLADLSVTSSTSFAYEKLWAITKQLIILYFISILIAMLGLSIVIRKIVKPIKDIQQSAIQISNHKFNEQLEAPHIQELADVVHAFNLMNSQLKTHFDQQAEEADKLRVRAYQDPVSGLANRNYMMTKLQSWLNTNETGGIALLHVDLIHDVYEQQGYDQGDTLTRMLSSHMMEIISDEYTIARLNQSEFMLLAPNIEASELKALGQSMLNMTASLQSDPLDLAPLRAAVALVIRQENDDVTSLLSQADNTLVKAQNLREEPLAMFEPSNQAQIPSFGKKQWKAIVDEAIANRQFVFSFQNAINHDNSPLHQEVFAAIEKDGQHYSAGQFLSSIERLDAGVQFDMHIIEQVFKYAKEHSIKHPIAINITQNSVINTGFMRWLGNKMSSFSDLSSLVFFEIPEVCFIKYPDDVRLLCDIIDQHKFQFGIDNFGHNFGSIGYLNEYRPAYVKLDFAYTHQIDDQAKSDVLSSITRTAKNLSVMTIASRVETLEQKDKLAELNVDAFQGYVTASINKINDSIINEPAQHNSNQNDTDGEQ